MTFLAHIACILLYFSVSLDQAYGWGTLTLEVGLTQDEKYKILDLHNYYREMTAAGAFYKKPWAANMMQMQWDDVAAKHAQEWANNCGGPPHGNHPNEGQNYAASMTSASMLESAFTMWDNGEASKWHTQFLRNWWPKAGHYSQVVWHNSYKVGCGFNVCKGHMWRRFICNYSPPGNFGSQPAYRIGRPCSACPWWRNKCINKLLCGPAKVDPNRPCKNRATLAKCTKYKKYCNYPIIRLGCRKFCKVC